jgi:probable F420-dependent oxidoreductase
MNVDVMTVPEPLSQIGGVARQAQSAGFSGLLITEVARTPYLSAAVASQAAPGLDLSTGVAVAFPRSPFVTAATAWELQEATAGKFRLGLGTQVRTHVVRRYGMAFDRPGPRLRDYVLAVKACFSAFRTGKLDHHGEFYNLDFITPQWSPGPIDAPDPKVDIAAVNPWMLRMAGEVADGVHVHPIGEPGYIARHVLPNVAAGAAKARRPPSDIALIVPVLTIAGDSDEERDKERELVRASMSFYGSTPNYAFIWDEAGFEGTTARIREKQKAGDFAGMAAQITDEHVAAFATEATWDGLAGALTEKYGGLHSDSTLSLRSPPPPPWHGSSRAAIPKAESGRRCASSRCRSSRSPRTSRSNRSAPCSEKSNRNRPRWASSWRRFRC